MTDRPVLLVGSVPLETAEAVMSMAGEILGQDLRYLPDGETGIRKNWASWQVAVMDATPFLKSVAGAPGPYQRVGRPIYHLDGPLPANAAFGPLGYAEFALESFQTFKRLKAEGRIPAGVRFMVALPTPLAPMTNMMDPKDLETVEPLYARAMRGEVERICAAIPAGELSIQWDVAVEFAILEGLIQSPIGEFGELVRRLAEIGRWVPAGVALGYHFCYGDAGHKHFKEPEDMGLMVRLANALFAASPRTIDFLHMPVPRGRNDAAYFKALSDLRLPGETQLYLGLVHRTDGIEGARRRIEAATRFAPTFGVATECGWGRRPPETVPELMKLNAEVARA